MNDFRMIAVHDLVRRPDHRPMKDEAFADLADSIDDIGLLNPLTVRAMPDGRYQIIAGSHRYAACDALGFREIACQIVTLDDLHAELAMIDENLRRAALDGILLEKQLRRRKAIYEELHPQTRAHVAGAHASNSAQGHASANLAPAFTAETAALTGKSERTIQRAIERGEKITSEAAEILHGTPLDKGTYRDELKNVPAAQQAAKVQSDLKTPPRPTVPKPTAGEAFTRFLSLASDLGKLVPKDIVAGIPVANRRAELSGHVSGLRTLLETIAEIMEGVVE